MKKTKKARRKHKSHHPRKDASSIRPSWVDRVRFETVRDDGDDDDTTSVVDKEKDEEIEDTSWISLISWNVLAHSYCSRNSQTHLPPEYQKIVFHPTKRKQRILDILERFAAEETDILCLQEVDMDEVGDFMKTKIGWQGIETPRQKHAGSGVKLDSSAIFFNPDQWKLCQHQVVTFDDLATLSNSTCEDKKARPEIQSNLQGLQQSFLRRNVGLLVRLQDVHTQQTFVLVNTHLFWNPNFEYVKFCQIHYLMQKAREFCAPDEAFVLCGDLNSKPCGSVYNYLSKGRADGRRLAPWNVFPRAMNDNVNEETEGFVDQMANLKVQEEGDSNTVLPEIRYLLDFTLNKLCRWLRILGIDTALETFDEERARTKDGKMILFDRCREEGRTLITTSTRLVQRNDCPPGTYLVSPQSLPILEPTFVHILLTHGVALDPTKFLTRCVVCNGGIVEVDSVEEKERILKTYDAPTHNAEGMEVYECVGCRQGYWWSDKPNSSASRVKSTTTHLFELCLQAGVPLLDDTNLGFFGYVDIDKHKKKGWENSKKGSNLVQQKLDVLEWLKSSNVVSPFGTLRSAYAQTTGKGRDNLRESLPFTNVTYDFVDTLDYIWYDASKLKVKGLLWVPKSFPVLNEMGLPNGHVVPSDVFPSDHLAIGARMSLQARTSSVAGLGAENTRRTSSSIPFSSQSSSFSPGGIMSMMTFAKNSHSPRCDCGCVPAIPSLFEMAEMRKQARERKQNELK